MFSKIRKLIFLFIIVLVLLPAVSACSSAQPNKVHLNMMSMEQMPAEVQSAPVSVQTAYQFAAANPGVLRDIPCYCGCGNVGHTSNYSCYVSSEAVNGQLSFDPHALGCSICVDITQDVMRILRDGKSTQDARAYIDATYSKYGPSNIP